jgi:subtilase family serine protease
MRITSRFAAMAAVFAGAVSLWAPTALAAGPVAGAARVGSAPAHKQLTVLLPLKVDQRGLAAFATAVSTPGSAQYGHYASMSTIARRFGAPSAVRARVISFLQRSGATHVTADRTGLDVSATLSVSRAQRLFGTRLSSFQTDAKSGVARFVAPESATHLPGGLAGDVTGVVGLDTQPLAPTPAPAPAPAPQSLGGAADGTAVHSLRSSDRSAVDLGSAYLPRTGTASGCAAGRPKAGGFTPNQYLTAYGLSSLHSSGFTGAGERVALLEIDGFKPADITRFDRCFELPTPHVKLFGVGIKQALAPGGETTLDLEVLTAAAPRLSDVDVYESSAVASAVLKSLIDAIESKTQRPDVVSASLGGCEADNRRALGNRGIGLYEHEFEVAASAGISVLAAAGDDGSSTCLDQQGDPTRKLSVSFPASSPFVTAVGGTNIALNAANQIIASVVWNDGPGQAAAGGGGNSVLFGEPSYQDAFQTSTRRETPDVSMLADLAPGYEIFCTAKPQPCSAKHGWLFIGGTSAGTPLLAGGVAVADQALRQAGRSGLGFVNPLLYSVASSNAALAAPAAPTSVFSDVTIGSNDLFATAGSPLGCCSAVAGYDDATGLGQINVANLTAVAKTIQPALATVSAAAVSPQSIAKHKLVATVTCSVACIQGATATIRIAGGPTATVTAVPAPAAAATAETVKLGITPTLASTLNRALAAHHKVTATIVGTVVDGAGKTERRSAPVAVVLTP